MYIINFTYTSLRWVEMTALTLFMQWGGWLRGANLRTMKKVLWALHRGLHGQVGR